MAGDEAVELRDATVALPRVPVEDLAAAPLDPERERPVLAWLAGGDLLRLRQEILELLVRLSDPLEVCRLAARLVHLLPCGLVVVEGCARLLGSLVGARLIDHEVLEEGVHVGDGRSGLDALLELHGAVTLAVATDAEPAIDRAQERLLPVMYYDVREGRSKGALVELGLRVRRKGPRVELVVRGEEPCVGIARRMRRHVVDACRAERLARRAREREDDRRPVRACRGAQVALPRLTGAGVVLVVLLAHHVAVEVAFARASRAA